MRMVIENLALHDQIGQLEIYCDYGVTADGKQDEEGCPQVIHLADRKGHMEICEYCPVVCPNSDDCPPMKRRDLSNHLANCNKARCANHDKGIGLPGRTPSTDQGQNSARMTLLDLRCIQSGGQSNHDKGCPKVGEKETIQGKISKITLHRL